MLSWIIGRKIDAFETEFSYDMDYARMLLRTSRKAMILFHKATGLGTFRQGVPDECWHAARIFTARQEDCGPCTQLVASMAEREGIPPATIRAALTGTFDELSPDARLAASFTRAVLARAPEADSLRRDVVERFGDLGLVSLAFAMLSSRLYPTLKYALGFGHSCAVVRVAGDPVLTPHEAL
ncbi:MAG: hypothetical protein WBG86_21630 [Polyangiales bacterium]